MAYQRHFYNIIYLAYLIYSNIAIYQIIFSQMILFLIALTYKAIEQH